MRHRVGENLIGKFAEDDSILQRFADISFDFDLQQSLENLHNQQNIMIYELYDVMNYIADMYDVINCKFLKFMYKQLDQPF